MVLVALVALTYVIRHPVETVTFSADALFSSKNRRAACLGACTSLGLGEEH